MTRVGIHFRGGRVSLLGDRATLAGETLMQWEHQIVILNGGVEGNTQKLNSLGEKSWELVAVVPGSEDAFVEAYFKRQKTVTSSQIKS